MPGSLKCPGCGKRFTKTGSFDYCNQCGTKLPR
jgi:rRNA maturation endonuclease Nob1